LIDKPVFLEQKKELVELVFRRDGNPWVLVHVKQGGDEWDGDDGRLDGWIGVKGVRNGYFSTGFLVTWIS